MVLAVYYCKKTQAFITRPCKSGVCASCLENIISNNSVDVNSIRCPICRESITLPQGGVSAFPPSFLVNQLLDLMARQRREIVPKCATHMSQELLFCETCDMIFCIMCEGSVHGGTHTVIPFSIAIKRMSEILIYKAQSCVHNLNSAQDNVATELDKLEVNSKVAIDAANQSFDALQALINKRRQEVLANIDNICGQKKRAFREQQQLIEAEKVKVERDCEGLESEMEVRHITKKIADLNERLDATSMLAEPRENAFITYQWEGQMEQLISSFTSFGKIRTSSTFPALCKAEIGPSTTFLKSEVLVSTIDFNGRPRVDGGDPIDVILKDSNGDECHYQLTDKENGTYSISYMPHVLGTHYLNISIFDRAIRGSPFELEVTPHISPVSKVGGKGNGFLDFSQPTSVAIAPCGTLYILDTGNNRIKLLGADGSFIGHMTTDGLEKQGCTGRYFCLSHSIAITPCGTLMAVNWRTKLITELDRDGKVVKQFTSPELQQPTCIAVSSNSDVIIADNTAECLFIFDHIGRLKKKVYKVLKEDGSTYVLRNVSGLTVAPNDDILVADNHIISFSPDGAFKRTITNPPVKGKAGGFYSGITVDVHGNILATKTERGRACVEVHRIQDHILFYIDSFSDKLKRPAGLITTPDYHVYVCDLGNDSLKKYKYR
ncbi:hypothetical protein EB796_003075 [Bugula neritina]|uniref:B box-type domain-containing protein n=1 Tax=Bugula neritina TaxID=10212 RepID=A0A7J7KJ56_BUGNE|nr:hypothetical protein EB796_003075 [Bugula neritina]